MAVPMSSRLRRASTNSTSAPASESISARASAGSSPSTATASVRAMISVLGSRRASQAARILPAISWAEISVLPSRWPQRLGAAWSSNWIAEAPARSSTRTVCITLSALPKPVSASTISGRSTRSRILRVTEATSSSDRKPMSGRPKRV
ncbi:hypothetical protein D3C85_1409350 [compost metagenome]